MAIIHLAGRNILFMHVPKTAGTSVEAWLESIGPVQMCSTYTHGYTHSLRCTPQHLDAHDIRCLFRDGYFAYAFLFVREPYARVESEYRYLCLEKRVRLLPEDGGEPPAFAKWVVREMQAAESDPWALDNHLRPQWEFVYPGAECFKLEDGLLNGLRTVASRIGVPAPDTAPTVNKTAGMPIETAWDDEARAAVAGRYARDFIEFGYPA